MTTRTITVNTPEETEVQICDECGLGSDEGELVEFRADDDDLDIDLHYHRSCAREQTGNPQTLSEAYHEAVEAEMDYEIGFVLSKTGEWMFLISLSMFAAGAIGAAFIPIPAYSTFAGFMLSATGLLCIALCVYVGQENGQKTAEELV